MAHHVVLVGLMGSGKTTIGRRLAARLDRHFVDADAALEEIADRSIAEIFEQDGEAAFRDLEADTFEELLEHHEPCVIASGGGLVLRSDNRARLRRPDVTVVLPRRRSGVPGQSGGGQDPPTADQRRRAGPRRS